MRRLIFLSLLLGAPLLVSAQTKPPASQPATSRYTNAEHKIEWPLLDDKRWRLQADPQAGVLAIIKHQEEMGGAHPMVMLSFDRLPKEVTTAASYAETNVSLLPKYGFSEIKQAEVSFAGLPAVQVDAVTDGRLFGLPLADLRSAVQQNGLSLPSAHIGGALTDNATSAAAAERLGITKLFVALPTEFSANRDGVFTMVGAQSIEQLDRLAERLNRAGRELRDRGITFGYHNHHVEFLPVDGKVPFDYLMANTDPDLVKIELDLDPP